MAFSTFFSQKLKTIWESKGNEAVDVQLTMKEGIDWMSNSSRTCPMFSWNSCTPACLAVSRCLGVGCFLFSNCTQEWGKFARSLDLDPNESEAQSAGCGAWAWWIIDLVADSLSCLTQSLNSSAALLKLNYCTTRWMKCLPKTLDYFHVSLCARSCQVQSTSTNKLTAMFSVAGKVFFLPPSSSQHS